MRHSTYNNKRLIWESKAKQIWLVAVSFLFVAACVWTKHKTSAFQFWGSIICFGGCGLLFLVRLLNPKNLFVTHDTTLGKQIIAEQFLKDQEDFGFIEYNERGFILTVYKSVAHYNWSDIESIFGFKEDHITADNICLEIFFNNKSSFRITEETLGWYQFNRRLRVAIPTIPENWEGGIILPAFATNMTLLFDRYGRTKVEVEKEHYD